MKAKFYVVWQGREAGIYDSWAACEAQVKGVAAKYKGFATREEAEVAFQANAEDYIKRPSPTLPSKGGSSSLMREERSPILGGEIEGIHLPALAVDAACSGNPGLMELRGVIADTGTQV